MKRIACLILSLTMIFSLCACGNIADSGEANSSKKHGTTATYTIISDDGIVSEATVEEIVYAKENNALEYDQSFDDMLIGGEGEITQILEDEDRSSKWIVVVDDQVHISLYTGDVKDTGFGIGDTVGFSGNIDVEDSVLSIYNGTIYDPMLSRLPHNEDLKLTDSMDVFLKAENLEEDEEWIEHQKNNLPELPSELYRRRYYSEKTNATLAETKVDIIDYEFYQDRFSSVGYWWYDISDDRDEVKDFVVKLKNYLDQIYGESEPIGNIVGNIGTKIDWEDYIVNGETYSVFIMVADKSLGDDKDSYDVCFGIVNTDRAEASMDILEEYGY